MNDRTEPVSRRRLLSAGVGGGAAMALAAASPARAQWCWWDCDTANPNLIRTPETAFAHVDFPYHVEYTNVRVPDVGEVRIASYVAGPWWGEPVLLMHGNPSWAYIYRRMIPLFTQAGYRVILPDLFGLGRSDKVRRERSELYTYRNLEEAMFLWFEVQEQRGLHRPNLWVQDYGGLVGLRILARRPYAFRRVVTSNTALPSGAPDQPVSPEFLAWRRGSAIGPDDTFAQFLAGSCEPAFPVDEYCNPPIPSPSRAMQGATVTELPPDVLAAYDAPYPSEEYLVALRKLASLVPIDPWQAGAQRNARFLDVLGTLSVPFLTLFGDSDPYTSPPGRGWEDIFQELIPGANGQPHAVLANTGHFSQEDSPQELVSRTVDWFRSTPA